MAEKEQKKIVVDLKIEMVDIEKVRPYEANPRKIPPEAIEKVANSIREFGFRQPIVTDKDYVIIAGHTRFQAAKALGLKQVPVHVANMTEEQARAYRIADNKTNEFASWDSMFLKSELDKLAQADFDLGLTGFGAAELEKALKTSEEKTPGSREFTSDDFDKFKHKCPRCGFEYDEDAKDKTAKTPEGEDNAG